MFDPYGKVTVLAPDGTTTRTASLYGNPFTFTGRRLDGETGLMYFRNRMYSVDLGRFVGRDPLGYVDGMGLYNGYFVPNRMDPKGLITTTKGIIDKNGKINQSLLVKFEIEKCAQHLFSTRKSRFTGQPPKGCTFAVLLSDGKLDKDKLSDGSWQWNLRIRVEIRVDCPPPYCSGNCQWTDTIPSWDYIPSRLKPTLEEANRANAERNMGLGPGGM